MKIAATTPDSVMLEEMGSRARAHRVGMNLTQPQLAEAAGVSSRTIERLESGTPIQLDKLLRILRALRLTDNLDQLFPEVSIRPLQQIGAKPKVRQRARTAKAPGLRGAKPGWVWGDKK